MLLMHGPGQADQQLIGSCAGLLIHLLHAQDDLADHAAHYLHQNSSADNNIHEAEEREGEAGGGGEALSAVGVVLRAGIG